jgi:hypothetical protein
MICLSKNKSDEYIERFAKGANLPIYDYDNYPLDGPLLIRSMGKKKLIHWCWKNNYDFYYMDSGYVGNYKCKTNPRGWKVWHRIVRNDVQHSSIIERPDDRWRKLDYKIYNRKQGSHILLVTPSEKPCKFYGIDLESWKKETIEEIKKYTDRPIIIREKTDRPTRLSKTIFQDLENCHAVVTYQSIAAVESVLHGVPAFTLAPTAADPVCDKDLSNIENPLWEDLDTRTKWAHHLAYGQYHNHELESGKAYRMLIEDEAKIYN